MLSTLKFLFSEIIADDTLKKIVLIGFKHKNPGLIELRTDAERMLFILSGNLQATEAYSLMVKWKI